MSLVNPVLYMVNGFRYGILGVSDISIYVSLAIILVFSAFLFSIAYFLLDKGVGIRNWRHGLNIPDNNGKRDMLLLSGLELPAARSAGISHP